MSENQRRIIHVDMDAFYASVEQRDNPELRGKPVAVGGNGRRGVVSAASYEARKFGVHSAMASFKAAQLCPDLIFVKSNFDAYKEASSKVREIFFDYTDLVEPLALDEAYLDVTATTYNMKVAELVAVEIRQRIKEATQLNASAGVSVNKFLAKVASDYNKPNGLKVIPQEEVDAFMLTLAVKRIPGVGKVTQDKMKRFGIETCADLQRYEKHELVSMFGKSGKYYFNACRGIHHSEVKVSRIRKSLGAERTFMEDLKSPKEMETILDTIIEKVIERMEKGETKGKTVTLKIKYLDFVQQTRSKTVDHWVYQKEEITAIVRELLYAPTPPERAVRLLGVTLSNLNTEESTESSGQLELTFD